MTSEGITRRGAYEMRLVVDDVVVLQLKAIEGGAKQR